MPVFTAYFKVARAAKVPLLLNLGIFLLLAVLLSGAASEQEAQFFAASKIPFALINEDEEGALARGLAEFLAEKGRQVPLAAERETLQDALFFRTVEYIAVIPRHFSERFLAGENPRIEKVIVPDSTSSYYVDQQINKFLNTALLYHLADQALSEDEIIELVQEDLKQETKVEILTFGEVDNFETDYHFYFRYAAYVLLSVIIAGISTVMISFNKPDLYLRNLSAPTSIRRVNGALLAGHLLFALAIWLLLLFLAAALYRGRLLNSGLMGFFSLNTLAFTFVCASIGFAVGGLVKNHDTMVGAVQVIALGLNFLGGVFVPQAVLGRSVLAVAKFLPSFWFVRANDLIGGLGSINKDAVKPIYESIFLQLGFAAAIFAAVLLFRKGKRKSHLA